MAGLSTLFNFGENNIEDPIYYEKDYTFEFGILKNWSIFDIVTRIKNFLPHWINADTNTDTEHLIYSISGGDSGLKYLYDQLKTLISDCFFGSAIGEGLQKLALEYAKISPRIGEHDWHLRYRLYEMLYEMKPTRSNLDRLIIKWLGIRSFTKLGSDVNFIQSTQRYTLPETYHYIVRDLYYKDLEVYKNNKLLTRGIDYEEIGKLSRRSRIVDFLKPIYASDDLRFVIKNFSPYKKIEITGSDLVKINRYQFNFPISDKYMVSSVEDINLLVYKNGTMLKRFDDYLEVGEENDGSNLVYIYEQPLPTDIYTFEVLGHFQSEGYHMYNSKHHILEQQDYGFYGGASNLCTSTVELSIGDLVNMDLIERTAILADASLNLPAMGIVSSIVGSIDQPYYIIQSTDVVINRTTNYDGTYVWNFTDGIDLYLGEEGQIQTSAHPDLSQLIGISLGGNRILLPSESDNNKLLDTIPQVNTFFNSPTAKFNRPGVIYIILKNAIQFGADFINYKPKTAFYGDHYESLTVLGYDSQNIMRRCLRFVSKIGGILPSNYTVTILNGSTNATRTIILNQGQTSEETYTDLDMNETLTNNYIVDQINNNSLIMDVERLVSTDIDILPIIVNTTTLGLTKYAYYDNYETLRVYGNDEYTVKFSSKTTGELPIKNTITVEAGSVSTLRNIIINEGQTSEEIYTDVNMNSLIPTTYLVDLINTNSLLVSATSTGNETLPDLLTATPLILDTEYHPEDVENNITKRGLGFYGLSSEVILNGITANSKLDNLMKELLYSKPVGIHLLFELHPLGLEYKENRYIRNTN